MFKEFFAFELRYWLRGWMLYIFVAIMAVLFFAAASSDDIQVGRAFGNTFRNAPYVIQSFYASASLLTILMVTAFIDSAASRDFTNKTSEIIFSKPISKASYVHGRFIGALLISTLPCLGVSIGVILAGYMPWNDPEMWRSVDWAAHLKSIAVFVIPNSFLLGAIVFIISVLTRSTLYSFMGTLAVLVVYTIASVFLEQLENQNLASLLDPLGFNAFSIATKYWSVEEKNTLSVGLEGLLLTNRLVWIGIASIIYAMGYARFSFVERNKVQKPAAKQSDLTEYKPAALTTSGVSVTGNASPWSQFLSYFRNDFFGVIRSTVFLVLIAITFVNLVPLVWFSATEGYGLSSFPVTYRQVELIQGGLLVFIISIITFFSGVLVWRDRDVKMHEILGALPYPTWIAYLSKLLTLVLLIAILFSCGIAVGVVSQLASGYSRLQLDVYIKELLVIDLARMCFLAVLALLMHAVAPNKYIGYFLFIIALVVNSFLWGLLRIDSLLPRFGRIPPHTYSDMFEFAPYATGLTAFIIYWSLFCLILGWITVRVIHRGVYQPLSFRWKRGIQQATASSWSFLLVAFALWGAVGSVLAYNTLILNKPIGSKELEERQVSYEKEYKKYSGMTLPSVSDVKYEIDIYPEQRKLVLKGNQELVNSSQTAIDTLFINLNSEYENQVSIDGATLVEDDKRHLVQQYRFEKPFKPGDKTKMTFSLESKSKGIENAVTNIEVNQNGTFFNNAIVPQMGYQEEGELRDPSKRRSYGLEKNDGFPALTKEKNELCMHHYVGTEGWVNVETVISTSADQIAVAPGSLIEQWEDKGRKYFRYRLDHPSLNFYSFISARYAVAREKWNDVDIEVYYHPEHHWNVAKMQMAMKDALEYCSKNFGPYRHKQARIIEFPRTSSFAQAFPGTMPYSESIGFIANLEDPEDIDMVYYVVCHEMAHQWWAHQVVGAKMQGATLLSETMAQYSSLMMMEKRFGREMMRKFLKYEMDNYLSSRGREFNEEKPLLNVNPNQGYIHYNKGSVVLYYLKEMIGEERINLVLRRLVERYAYQNPPYPTAYDLVDGLKEVMPAELHYLIGDLFERITMFSNRVESATVTPLADGKFKVVMDVRCEKTVADGKGKTTKVPINDWMDVGFYAKPETGKKYGREILRKRVLVDREKMNFEFVLDEQPEQCGIDPHYLMIDSVTDDNLKRATVLAAESPKENQVTQKD
jgi:ABC-type transport system involved in multi-copper enzyme maturation permease subunit